MKNYKFLLIIFSFIILGVFVIVTYVDMPAPDNLKNKILDVNDKVVR
tara:strand:+ start:664 stop:804 length:141 start_codon:yes stop_codon:yes gene_type:complete